MLIRKYFNIPSKSNCSRSFRAVWKVEGKKIVFRKNGGEKTSKNVQASCLVSREDSQNALTNLPSVGQQLSGKLNPGPKK